ncbi:uncharacterized protein RG961_011530 isoform 2-T2 [Leptosomus discolor]
MNHVGQYWKVFLAEVSLRHFLEEGCLTKRKFLCPCLIYVLQTRVIVGEGCLLELQVSGHLVTPAFMRQCDGVDTPGWGPGLASIPPTPHTSTAPAPCSHGERRLPSTNTGQEGGEQHVPAAPPQPLSRMVFSLASRSSSSNKLRCDIMVHHANG